MQPRRSAALIAAVLFIAHSVPGPLAVRHASAGFAEGVAAFDSGDLRRAYAEWLPLAEAGDPQAQVALAGLLESGGPGLERDLAAALQWYRRGARNGHPIAQMNLGEFYARGRGVPRDDVRALAWFSLAAEQGQAWAAKRRRELLAELSAEQSSRAALLAEELRPGKW